MNLLTEIHFWSLKESVSVKHKDFGAHKYFSKKDVCDSVLYNGKKSYCSQRGKIWYVPNKRPNNVKDKLKELEEYLLHDTVVCGSFENDTVQLLLSKGILAVITVNPANIDITSIQFTKFSRTDWISSGLIKFNRVYYITDTRLLHCHKEDWTIDAGFRRNLDVHEELICVWGCTNADKLQPWCPLSKDHQKSNVTLYWMGPRGPELIGHKKTEGDPLLVTVSRAEPRTLITVEQKVSAKGAVTVDVNTLDLTGTNLKRLSTISVPLQTQTCCSTLSADENRLLLGCIDGTLAVLNRQTASTQLVKTPIIPTFAAWHPSCAFFAIANDKRQLQIYDAALTRINVQVIGEETPTLTVLDLSGYLAQATPVALVKWATDCLIVALQGGPIVAVSHVARLDFCSGMQRYLTNDKVEQAIALLLAWDWNDQCLSGLQKIVAVLMRKPMTEENAYHLQRALSCYYSPGATVLSVDVRHKYGVQVLALTRRFFHQLVRYKMFDTAFLLAIDIGHHDLFMDLYFCATAMGEREMAAAARAQASSLLSRCSSAASVCSRSSCSQCSHSQSDEGPASTPPITHNDYLLTTNFNEIDPAFDIPKIPIRIKPPPLPIAPYRNVPFPVSKKPAAKVKFSDTVTAFIVPEIKRPVRPAPPPHLTDPQKELADSLPLCHPNEDYLKDFAPVRHETDEAEKRPPKIKVVHFGVV